MLILGIDPGINNTGWCILLSKGNLVKYISSGIIKNSPKDSTHIRLANLSSGLENIIEQFNPDICSLEEIFVNSNMKSSLILGYARGVILSVIGKKNKPYVEYAPNNIKKTIVGNGKADKQQVQKMLKLVISDVQFSSNDEADAIAIAYTASVNKLFLGNM